MEDRKRASADYLKNRTEAGEEARIERERAPHNAQRAHRKEGTRPLSSANPGPGKQGGDVRHVANTGLPPGVHENDLWDPGAHGEGKNAPVKNRS
jgi:hypothetical protein